MNTTEIARALRDLDELRADAEYFTQVLDSDAVWQQYYDARDALEAQLQELVVLSLETGRHVLIPVERVEAES